MDYRKKVFVNSKIQGSYMIVASALIFLTGICVCLTTYCVFFSSLTDQIGVAKLAAEDFQFITSSDMIRIIWILSGVFVLSLLIGLFFIFYTHRLVGPLIRFYHAFGIISKGDYSIRLKLRKKDCLHELADSFNQMVEQLDNKYSVKNGD